MGDEEPLPWKDPYIEGSPNDMGDKSVRSESVNISDEEQVVNNGKNSIGGYEDDFSGSCITFHNCVCMTCDIACFYSLHVINI